MVVDPNCYGSVYGGVTRPGRCANTELRDEEIVLVARHSPARLGGRFANSGMAARLLIDRAGEPR